MSRDDADAASMGFRSSGEVSDWQRAQGTRQAEPVALSTLTDERMDEIMRVVQAISNHYAFVGDRAFPRGREKLREVLAPLAASAPALQAGQGERDPDAPWLTKAHMLCTDHGIPQGRIADRLDALRDRFSEYDRRGK